MNKRNSSSEPKEENLKEAEDLKSNETDLELSSTTKETPLKVEDDPEMAKNERKANVKNSTDTSSDSDDANGKNMRKLLS